MTSLAHSVPKDRRLALVGVAGFALALAAASQVAIPLPGTPVPLTLQPMLVVLAGMMLGPSLGAWSMLLYLAAGAAYLPVFAPGGAPGVARFFGPTGGYLLAYPAAAFLAGWMSRRLPSLAGRWFAAVAGIAVLYVSGAGWLLVITSSPARAIMLGVTPFAAFDVVKALAAALIARPRAPRAG